ncbi:hypothetical protein [Xanthobacter aminoxidans]|uniref:hypothetical protein n=1 Tax=Xanthobacter aminoxidans TaxID=186280 RepID=UPI0037280FD0
MTLVSQLLIVTDAFSRARGLSQSRVATLLFNDGKKLALLRAGGDLVTGSYERALCWLSENWPEDAPWPSEVRRPHAFARPPEIGEGSGEGGRGEDAGHAGTVTDDTAAVTANDAGGFA